MTTHTLDAPRAPSLRERLADTALDPARGREREFRLIFAITFAVLVMVFALARIAAVIGAAPHAQRSIVQEARSAALAALPYAYRH